MVSKEVISKSLDDALVKCMPNFASMHTIKQIAKYFHLKYDGLAESSEIKNNSYVHDEGKFHKFIDPKNEDCNIFIHEDLFDKKTGNLKDTDWYNDEYLAYPEDYSDLSDDDVKRIIQEEGYPLKQLMKDYDDLPQHIKSSVEEIVFSSYGGGDASGRWTCTDNGKGTVLLYSSSIGESGIHSDITQNVRMVLFHEMGHAISHNLGYEAKEGVYWDIDANYLAETKDYKNGRRDDRKLTGDFYATAYGRRSKSKVEEQADVTMAMLLKACGESDPNYKNYRMELAKSDDVIYNEDDYLSVDDFLSRYPNRVKALNKYLNLDLT